MNDKFEHLNNKNKIMKANFYIAILSLLVLSSCGTGAKIPQKQITIQTFEDKSGREQLIGEVDKKALEGENYIGWFKYNFDNYSPNEEAMETIKKSINKYDIDAFFGSWCGDSKREIPKFYKILELSDYNLNRLRCVALGRYGKMYKKSPDHEEEGLNITNVPTFIFYNKNGEEVGRFVERATTGSLESDIAKILSKKEYKHSRE